MLLALHIRAGVLAKNVIHVRNGVFKIYFKNSVMIHESIERALVEQIQVENNSSNLYLAMASWCEVQGFNGAAQFLFMHSEEERSHMLKLFKFVNERGGHAVLNDVSTPKADFNSFTEIFEELLAHEIRVSQAINELVGKTLDAKDYTTHNFLQWYVSEQIEEEALARTVLEKLKLIGNDKGGLYLFDNDLEKIAANPAEQA